MSGQIMKHLVIGSDTYDIQEYTLPIASSSTLGGIKVGSGLSIDSSTGVLTATGTSVTVDTEMSDSSTNPVQNKVIKAYSDGLIAALDGGTIGTPGTGKTVSSVSQTDGNISIGFSDISITKSQVSDFSHAHGNITSGGDITATAPTIANGDQLVINDNSASKITNGPTFDGSTTTKALSQKGTWETFLTEHQSLSGYVPTSRTINSKALTDNITLSASDVGASASDHTHTLSIASDSGTSSLSMSANTKYKLTAGGETYIFTTPSDTTYESKSAASGGTAVSLVTTGEKYTWNNKSDLTIGTTGTTAAAGNHTHTTTLASDSGTSTITLASAGKYKLTAGDTSVIFTMPTIPTVDYPVTSVAGKTGAVTLESSDVGLGNVGNFKAVSTVASQGLTSTEQSNARANIGAGTSSLTLGTTSTTAAAGDHTHTLSMATSSGTSSIDLEANTKYQLTAGGSTYIFKTPAGGSSTDSYHTSGSWSGLTYTATAVGNAGTLAFTIPTGTTSTTVSAGNHSHTFASITSKPTTLSGYGITDGTAADHTHPYDNNYKFVLNTSDALYTSINNMGWTSDVII